MSMESIASMRATSAVRQAGLAVVLAATALSAAAQSQSGGGMRITRDPVTGELRAPTAEENAALSAAAPSSSAPATPAPQVVNRPDGSKSLMLTEEQQTFSVMTRNADGSLSLQCVTGESNAKKIVLGKAKTAARTSNKGAQQ